MVPHDNQLVMVVDRDSINYGFHDEAPSFGLGHGGSYFRQIKVDPAPAYIHDIDAVRAELNHCRAVAPLPFPLAIFLLPHEDLGRTNGTYYDEHNYQTDDRIKVGADVCYPPVGFIVLSGKRIPIHPAMTRYLVGHEYGHGVMYHLARKRGLKSEQFLNHYQEQCRPNTSRGYGCGRWHRNVGELFANDFRILIAKRELEFWPHEQFSRPEDTPAVVAFWAEARVDLLVDKVIEVREQREGEGL